MRFVHAFILALEIALAACFLLFLDSIKDSIDLVTAFYIGMALVFFGSAVTAGTSVWLYYQFRGSDRPSSEAARARLSQSGNIFFALFGAVALVGVVGATLTTVLKGPVTGMQRVTKYTIAENNMIAAGKLALIAAGLQAEGGDCDGDGMIEPVPFSTTEDGPFPDGGGYLSAEIGASRQDPWGNLFGYCVWDHGVDPDDEADNDGECGQSSAYLAGDDSEQHIVLAVISSGPDRVFQTRCGPHPDYVTKASGSDDIVLTYTYAEAGSMSGGLWRLKSGDADTAEVSNRNIEVTGSSGSDVARIGFDKGLGLSGVGEFLAVKTDNIYSKSPSGAVILQSPLRAQMVDELESPPDSGKGGNGMGCANPLGEMGDIIFNRQHKVLQYCNGDAWIGLWGGDVSAGLPDCPAGAALVSNGEGWICGLPDQVPPVWQTATALPSAHVGEPYSHTVVATDNNGSVFYQESFGGLSSWINFDAQSGELSGTPDVPGTFTVTIAARDGAGNFATRSFSIPVIAAPCAQSLAIGCTAQDGAVYAGSTVGGAPMYVAAADEGSFTWGGDCKNDSAANHEFDGLANTNVLVADGHGHPAAEACRAKGPDWYLPAIEELFLLDQDRSNLIAANLPISGTYWSSTEFLSYTSFCTSTGPGRATAWRPQNIISSRNEDKDRSHSVRCVRR